MKIVGMEIFPLRIPFTSRFQHAGKTRAHSDSIVIKLYGDDGTTGYGETVARPYVTGETVPSCLQHMQSVLWPAVHSHDYPELKVCHDPLLSFAAVERSLPNLSDERVIAWHGARAGFETALIDLLLKQQGLCLSDVLPPQRPIITYSGVIGLDSIERARQTAQRYQCHGLTHIKCKVTREDIEPRLLAIRKVMGSGTSLRLDANCAFSATSALEVLTGLEQFDLVCIEQPTPRIDEHSLAQLQQSLSVPIMADESLITIADGRRLIAAKSCQWFNLRIAKCGGLVNTLRIARLATMAGIRLQIGCQVGETAILSILGRHLAAYLKEAKFVEGSYGSMLLQEDIAEDDIHFGVGGKALPIHGPGIGVQVREAVIRKYTTQILTLGEV